MATRKGKMMTTFPDETTRPDIPSVLPPPVAERVPEPDPVQALLDIGAYRLAASMLLTYSVDGDGVGTRSTIDPVYRLIVEGRVAPKYSSCGDLAHWLLYRLGVRAPFINRNELRPQGWVVEANLNRLCPKPVGSCPVAIKPSGLTEMPDVQAGDLLQITNEYGGHEICVSGRSDAAGVVTLTTAEYGQPGGAKKTHELKLVSGSLFVAGAHGAYHVVSWIPLPAALALPGRVDPDVRALTQAERETLGKGFPGFGTAPAA